MRQTKADEKVTISVVGAGNRATIYVKEVLKHYPHDVKIKAVFDPNVERQKLYQSEFGVDQAHVYHGIADFVKQPRLSDIVIIGTQDDMHTEPALAALEKGYDIILEKPIAMSIEETVAIGKAAKARPHQMVAICHMLRHTPFFRKIKEIVDSKELGNVVAIQHNENVGYYHFAHSYVRGNWRNTDVAAPFIVAKSCHDFDILLYLLKDHRCERLSSFGSLTFFTEKNYRPDVMAPRCLDCSIEKECPYSALKIYSGGKIKSVVFDHSTAKNFEKQMAISPYGLCVFKSDNNVGDHQVTAIEFDQGVHATFTLSAFTDSIHRSLKIMCEYGEIRATETTREIEVTRFGGEKRVIIPEFVEGGHGGGDAIFMQNFMKTYLYGAPFDSTLETSIESHLMAYAAEASRVNQGNPIAIENYHKAILKTIE